MDDFVTRNRNQIDEIKRRWEDVILDMGISEGLAKDPANRRESYICPICGKGKNGDGLTFVPDNPEILHCFTENRSWDIIGLYMEVKGTDFISAVKEIASFLKITLEDGAGEDFSPIREETIMETGKAPQNGNTAAKSAAAEMREYLEACRGRINAPEAVAYLTGRGFTMENVIRNKIGFDPAADPAGKGHPAERIIIPVGINSYTTRAIDPNMPKNYQKMLPAGNKVGIFNEVALRNKDITEIFICESSFDALAVMERAGAEAIAINGAGNAESLIKRFESKRPTADFIIAAQDDSAGERAGEILRKGLLRLNIPYISVDLNGKYKDPAEFMQNERGAFLLEVEAALKKIDKPDNMEQYLQRDMRQDISDYKTDIKTGFANLDDNLRFLYPGLYVFAAGSGIGKTTFLLQMACQIAAQGKDVLFFSLEQSRLELTAKSLARLAAGKNLNTFLKAADIMNDEIELREQLALAAAKDDLLNAVGDKLGIIEGNFRCDVDFVAEYIRKYIRRNKVAPVIFIDYLQILQPAADSNKKRSTTKESVDSVVTDLKRFSREIKSPILAAASINRAAYFAPAETNAIKESGNIEFTADAVFFLQPRIMDRPSFYDGDAIERSKALSEEKKKRPRALDLICRKNRYGSGEFRCYFDYYSRNDLFIPISSLEDIAKIESDELAAGARQKKRTKLGGGNKDDGFIKPDLMPTWAQLTAKKQGIFFNMLQGRAIDTERNEIEFTFLVKGGRKYPAIIRNGTAEELSEAEYNELITFNRKHLPLYARLRGGSSFDEFGEDPEE